MKLSGAVAIAYGAAFFLAAPLLTVPTYAEGLTVDQLVEDRALWPSRIATNKPLTVQVIDANLEARGFRDLNKGDLLPLASISGSTIDVRVPGGTAVLFTEDTDLLERANYKKKHGREKAIPKPKPKPASASAPTSKMGQRLQGRLVQVEGKRVQPIPNGEQKNAKYYAFYHSAEWCPPCRAFTPKLVALYNRSLKKNPDIEVVFLSADRTAQAMDNYLKGYRMPWPAIRYSYRSSFGDVRNNCGRGIPGLVLYDSTGRVIAKGRGTVMSRLQEF